MTKTTMILISLIALMFAACGGMEQGQQDTQANDKDQAPQDDNKDQAPSQDTSFGNTNLANPTISDSKIQMHGQLTTKPNAFGTVNVVVSPANATYTIIDEPTSSIVAQVTGSNSYALPAGIYSVEFDDMAGFVTPASVEFVLPLAGNVSVAGVYQPSVKQVYGTVNVVVSPANATYTIIDEPTSSVVAQGPGNKSFLMPAGFYTLEYDDLPGFITPASESFVLGNGATVHIVGQYAPTP